MVENEKQSYGLLERAALAVQSRVASQSRLYTLMTRNMATKRSEVNFAVGDREGISLQYTERLYRESERGRPQVGDMPPRPRTLRAYVGAVLVKIVQRMLFWYTEQIRTFQREVWDAAGEQVQAFQRVSAEQRHQRVALAEMGDRLVAIERRLNLNQELALGRVDALTNQINGLTHQVSSFESRMVVNEQHIGKQDQAQLSMENTERQHRESLADRLQNIEQNLAALGQAHSSAEGFAQSLGADVREVRQRVYEAKTNLLQQELRLKLLIREFRKHPPVTDVIRATPSVTEATRHIDDPLFLDHARAFRGTPDDIRSRLAVYLPYAQDAFVAAGGASALDLGCGRGEWLEVLIAAGIPATGIDRNGDLVSGCQQRCLDVTEGDILDVLRSSPDQSRSVISAFHVLEHISFQDLLEIIDQAVRVLKQGGVAIFETPNPKNLFVSSNNFYLDPTHRHPLPSELLKFLIEARGLCDSKTIPLSPYPDYFLLEGNDCPAVRFINEHFYGPQDYGIVAWKA